MFRNIYGKRLLSSLRDKEVLVWTWIFPAILATMFYITFSSLDTEGMLSVFPLGIVDDETYRGDMTFQTALNSVSGEDGLFELSVFSGAEDADAALMEGDIEGYILHGEPPLLVVAGEGINQTIAKHFLDRYLQTRNSAELLLSSGAEAAQNLPALLSWVEYTKEISLSQSDPSNKVNYFYALLAMVCLYGSFQGLITVSYMQANLSPLGTRRTLAPVGRFRLVCYDLLGGVTLHLFCLLTVVAYISLVLKVSFGPKLWAVLLTCVAGTMLGVAFGAMVAVSSKLKDQAKSAVLITFSMITCFLSGLMLGGINYLIAEKAPIISWLNPAARITDAFYCLYYYDTYERYFLNIGIILAMTLVMFSITALFIRRQRYESI